MKRFTIFLSGQPGLQVEQKVQKLFAQWEINIQLVSDKCVELRVCDSNYVSL